MRQGIDEIRTETRLKAKESFLDMVLPQGEPLKEPTIEAIAETLIVAAVRAGGAVKVSRWLFVSTDGENYYKIDPDHAHDVLRQWADLCGLTEHNASTHLAMHLHETTNFFRWESRQWYLMDALPILRKHMQAKELNELKLKFKLKF